MGDIHCLNAVKDKLHDEVDKVDRLNSVGNSFLDGLQMACLVNRPVEGHSSHCERV